MTRGDRTVRVDIDCGACGYNLRGLQRSAACPECGITVKQAIRLRRTAAHPVYRRVGQVLAAGVIAFVLLAVLRLEVLPAHPVARDLILGLLSMNLGVFLLGWTAPHRAVSGRWSGPVGHAVKLVCTVALGAIASLLGLWILVPLLF